MSYFPAGVTLSRLTVVIDSYTTAEHRQPLRDLLLQLNFALDRLGPQTFVVNLVTVKV